MAPQKKKTRCFLFTPSSCFTDEEIRISGMIGYYAYCVDHFNEVPPNEREGKTREELIASVREWLKKIPADSPLNEMEEIQGIRREYLGTTE